MISIALLDTQNRLMLESLAALLSRNVDFTLTGQFSSANNFLKDLNKLTVNVLIINLYHIHSEEITLIKKISKEFMRIKVLVISMEWMEETVYETIRAGAKGYLTKQDSGSDVILAINTIRNGYDYFNKSISDILLKKYIKDIDTEGIERPKSAGNLSKREIEIIRFWGEGLSNKEMGEKLFISVRTVESHKNHIMQKLNLKTNIDLMKFAIRNNLINL